MTTPPTLQQLLRLARESIHLAGWYAALASEHIATPFTREDTDRLLGDLQRIGREWDRPGVDDCLDLLAIANATAEEPIHLAGRAYSTAHQVAAAVPRLLHHELEDDWSSPLAEYAGWSTLAPRLDREAARAIPLVAGQVLMPPEPPGLAPPPQAIATTRGEPGQGRPGDDATTPPPARLQQGQPGRDAEMLAILQDAPEAAGWSSRQWAKRLGCSQATVTRTDTWQALGRLREAEASDAADRYPDAIHGDSWG